MLFITKLLSTNGFWNTTNSATEHSSTLSPDVLIAISLKIAHALIECSYANLYKNNGHKGQICCKICSSNFSPQENLFSKQCTLRCPYCALVPKKDRKHFVIHKCVNPKCSYYLHNKSKVPDDELIGYKKNDYKLHYLYREFTVDFFKMSLDTLPRNASSLKFRKDDAHIMSLFLTLHVNLSLSLRKTPQALKDLYGISVSIRW